MNIDYTIDLDGFGFIRSVTNYTSLRDHRLTHRDKLSLKVRFTRSGVAQDVGTLNSTETHFTLKKLNEENEVLSDDSTVTTWTKTTSGTDVYYTHDGVVDLDTVEIDTLLGQAASVQVDAQFTWKVGSTVYRSRLLKTAIDRALYPSTLPATLATDPARSYVTMLQNVNKLDGDGSGTVALESISTVGLQVPRWYSFVRAVDNELYYYELRSGTDAESGITIRRPDDYNATTNPKVFVKKITAFSGSIVWGTINGTLSDQTDLQTALNTKEGTQVFASQAEMEAGTETAIRSMSPLRIHQAIDALAVGGTATWGSITGTLSAQTDLATALGLRMLASNNLSDLGSASAARTNLGLGTLATQSGTFSGTSSGTNTGDITIIDTETINFGLTSQALTGSVRLQMSLTSDASGIKLSGDSATPGNSKVYGTDGSGTKGWHDAATGDMTKLVYDPQGLNRITGLPGTANGAQTGGAGGQLIFPGGNAGPNAGEDGGISGSISLGGGNGELGLNGGVGGSINTTADGSRRGGNINTSASGFLRGGDIYTAGGGGDINTAFTGSIGLGSEGTRTTLTGAATSDRAISLPDASGTIALTSDVGNASNLTSGSLALARIAQAGATTGQAIVWNGSAWAPATVAASGATLAANTFTGLQQFSGTTHAGLRLNNLTTVQRDAIASPQAGMAIWNTTANRLQLHNGSGWTAGMVRLDGDAMTGALSVTLSALGTTTTPALSLINNTAATSGNQQVSPALTLRGNGWKTTATAASQTCDFIQDVLPVQGTTAPTGQWRLRSSINGAAETTVLQVTNTGALVFPFVSAIPPTVGSGILNANGSLMFFSDNVRVCGVGTYLDRGFIIGNSSLLGFSAGDSLDGGNFAADAFFRRNAAASIQMGANHATTATNQTFKAHNVTTGTGAKLCIGGGTGSVAGGAVSLATSATNGALVEHLLVRSDGVIDFASASLTTESVTSDRTLTVRVGGNLVKLCVKS